MKTKYFTLTALVFFFCVTMYSQNLSNQSPDSNSKALLGYEKDFTFNQKHQDPFALPSKDIQFSRKSGETIWVMDSLIKYDGPWLGEDYDWIYRTKTVSLLFDNLGNLISSLEYEYDKDQSVWVKKDTIASTYYEGTNQQNTYLRRQWDNTLEQWSDTTQFMEYSETGNILVWMVMYPTIGRRFIYTYFDSNAYPPLLYDEITHVLDQKKEADSNEWVNESQTTYTWDTLGVVSRYLTENWDVQSQEWVNNRRVQYNYDNNLNITRTLIVEWRNDIQEWRLESSRDYEYDVNGNKIFELQRFANDDNELVNHRRDTSVYNENNLLVSEETQLWDSSEQAWFNVSKDSLSYTVNGEMAEKIRQEWDSDLQQWVNDSRITYAYTEFEEWQSFQSFYWDQELNQWIIGLQTFYLYDEFGNLTEHYGQYWDEDNQQWINDFKDVYYWSELQVETTQVADLNNDDFNLYPNPVQNVLSIQSHSDMEITQVSIYSLSGQLVHSVVPMNIRQIDVSELTNGIYFIQLTSRDGKLINRKFVKQ